MAALQGSIRKEFSALQAADQRYGTLLQFTGEGLAKRGRQLSRAGNLQRGWDKLDTPLAQGNPFSLPPEIDTRYDDLVDIIQTMITHVGDMSNLILDPELDTYHLITATLIFLPKAQVRLARVIATGRDALARRNASLAERMALATDAAFLEQEDRDQIKAHLYTALGENKNEFHGVLDSFQTHVPVALAEYAAATDRFISLTSQLASRGSSAASVDEYIAAGVGAREASFALWDACVPELDNLLQARIAYYVRRRTTALLLSGLALLLAGLLAYRIATSLIHPLSRLSRLLTPGADLLDESVQKLAEFTRKGAPDLTTMRIICDELDAHAVNMRQTAQGLATIVDGREPRA